MFTTVSTLYNLAYGRLQHQEHDKRDVGPTTDPIPEGLDTIITQEYNTS